jgi:hypothetical protein
MKKPHNKFLMVRKDMVLKNPEKKPMLFWARDTQRMR